MMETFRALGLPQSIRKHLPILQRKGRYRESDYIESFISLFAAGGDCVDDFELLKADQGLKKLGLCVPSPEAVRFHAFCLMTNHVHFAIQVGEVPLSRIAGRDVTSLSSAARRLEIRARNDLKLSQRMQALLETASL